MTNSAPLAPASTATLLHLHDGDAADDTERGDVPGWVLVTVMSAGLVVLLWQFAGPALQNLFNHALTSVSGGISIG